MATPQDAAVLVADDHGNEVVFSSLREGVAGIRGWFNDALEASCQGLSAEGIEDMFPGLLARLRTVVGSVPVSNEALTLEGLGHFAASIAEKVLSVCESDDECEALGVPTRFSVRAASRLEVPDVAALAELAKKQP